MKRWEILAGLGAVALAVLGRVRQVLRLLASLVVVTVRVDAEIGAALASMLSARGRRVRSSSRLFQSRRLFLRPIRRVGPVVYENMFEASATYWYRHRPLWLGAAAGTKTHSLSYLRWTVKLDALLLEAADHKHAADSGAGGKLDRYRVVYHFGESDSATEKQEETGITPTTRLLRWEPQDCGSPTRGGLSGIVLSPVTSRVAEEVADWINGRDWYYEHCVPWRCGLMLHGEPGTGKTSLARALAVEHRLPVHVIDLTRMDNFGLRVVWQRALADTPCMIIIEDIDRIFAGDVAKKTSEDGEEPHGMTFDAFLNCIDGIEQVDGVLLVLTANHPERLDDALLRPGRVDTKVEIGRIDHATRLRLAERILGRVADAAEIASASGDVTAAAFVKLCRTRALDIRAGRAVPSAGPYR